MRRPNVDDQAYVAIVIFLVNAAHSNPNIVALFPPFFQRHHSYLRQKFPDLMPELDFMKASGTALGNLAAPSLVSFLGALSSASSSNPPDFSTAFAAAVTQIKAVWTASKTPAAIDEDLAGCLKVLGRIGRYDRPHAAATAMYTKYVTWLRQYNRGRAAAAQPGKSLQLAVRRGAHRVLCELDATATAGSADAALQTSLRELRCLAHASVLLEKLFAAGTAEYEQEDVDAFCSRVARAERLSGGGGAGGSQCLQLLAACRRRLATRGLGGNGGGGSIRTSKEGQQADAGRHLATLQELLAVAIPPVPLFGAGSASCSATLVQPAASSSAPVVFNVGLPLEVKVDAVVRRVLDASSIRIQIVFPDGLVKTITPAPAHLHQVSADRLRLRTSVYLAAAAATTAPFAVTVALMKTFPLDSRADPLLNTVTSQNPRLLDTDPEAMTGVAQLCEPTVVTVDPRKPEQMWKP